MKKKILISAPRFYGIDEAIREAFEKNGWDAILLNYGVKKTIPEKVAGRIGSQAPFLKPFSNRVIQHYLAKENEALIAAVRKEKPDILFIIKGDHLFPETLSQLKREGACPLISYIWDDPFYSYAGRFVDDYRRMNFERGMALYDFIFVYDTFYVEQIKKRWLSNVAYLPLATDPKRYRNIDISESDRSNYGYDLCFVGRPYPNRVEVLEGLTEYRLGVFGDGWVEYFSSQGQKVPAYYKGKAAGEKVLKIYCSSKIALNIHDPEAQEGLNTRTFDIPACGAFELVDHKKNLEIHFRVGEEMVAFKDTQGLRTLVDYYLENEGLLKKIAMQGRQRVLQEHTWGHRVQKVLAVLEGKGFIT